MCIDVHLSLLPQCVGSGFCHGLESKFHSHGNNIRETCTLCWWMHHIHPCDSESLEPSTPPGFWHVGFGQLKWWRVLQDMPVPSALLPFDLPHSWLNVQPFSTALPPSRTTPLQHEIDSCCHATPSRAHWLKFPRSFCSFENLHCGRRDRHCEGVKARNVLKWCFKGQAALFQKLYI